MQVASCWPSTHRDCRRRTKRWALKLEALRAAGHIWRLQRPFHWTSNYDNGTMQGMNIGTDYFAKAIEDKGCTKWTPTRGSASLPRPSPKGGRSSQYTFLRNEPISFSRSFRCIYFIYRSLCRLQERLQMGSFWENEPILRDNLAEILQANHLLRSK